MPTTPTPWENPCQQQLNIHPLDNPSLFTETCITASGLMRSGDAQGCSPGGAPASGRAAFQVVLSGRVKLWAGQVTDTCMTQPLLWRFKSPTRAGQWFLFSPWVCPTLCNPRDCSTPSSCPTLPPGVRSDSCLPSRWCHPTISSSAALSFGLQSFPASGSFPMSRLFASGGQTTETSASVLPLNI